MKAWKWARPVRFRTYRVPHVSNKPDSNVIPDNEEAIGTEFDLYIGSGLDVESGGQGMFSGEMAASMRGLP
jgi:hypothetical protein